MDGGIVAMSKQERDRAQIIRRVALGFDRAISVYSHRGLDLRCGGRKLANRDLMQCGAAALDV